MTENDTSSWSVILHSFNCCFKFIVDTHGGGSDCCFLHACNSIF